MRMRARAALRTAGLAAPLLLTGTASAATRVSWKPERIEIASPGARAVIERNPLRLEFEQGDGRAALSEVANERPAPQPLGRTLDPIAPGLDSQTASPLYAPLTFTVGSDSVTQYQGGLWGGNLMDGVRQGIQYSARRVLGGSSIPGGVRLVVTTDDPSGRVLELTVRGLGRGAIRVSANANPSRGVALVGDSFGSGGDEGFFGFGGRHNAVDQRGNVLSSFVQEENVSGVGGDPFMHPNGNTAAYYPQAEFYSSRPYGYLLAQPQLARFNLDATRRDAWNVSVSASSLDYVVAPGAAPAAMATLTSLSGRQPVPPSWALGPMMDRLTKNFNESKQDYESSVLSDLMNIRRYRLPLSAYRIEGWGFPAPGNDGLTLDTFVSQSLQSRVIAELRRRHIHPLVYLRPWITPGSAPSRVGLVARTADGRPYETTGTSGKKIELLDFSRPAAAAFWRREVTKALDLGADGFMADFGEEVLFDMHFANGETGATMHNRYLVLYERATRRAVNAYAQRHPGRTFWFFNRGGYSGLPGSTAYEGGNFPGDESTNWDHASGLASLTSDMLSRAVDGAYGYGTDIGGYFELTTPPTTRELFDRWAEWAALSPVFRLHGANFTGTHTPWSFGTGTVRLYDRLSRLHQAAIPLILSLWRQAERTGMPVTRPLWLQYPYDPGVRRQDQEWLLGPDVLVAPVVTDSARSWRVYFPSGCWRAPDNGAVYHGPRAVIVSAPLNRLPYFFRCGTGTRPF